MIPQMYQVQRTSRSEFVPIRNLQYHVRVWGEPAPDKTPLVMVHGWMDVAASYQFMVDALAPDHYIIAPDWRGFGLTASRPRSTTSGFPTTWPTWTFCSTTTRPTRPSTWSATAWAATWRCCMPACAPSASAAWSIWKALACPPPRPRRPPAAMPSGWTSSKSCTGEMDLQGLRRRATAWPGA